MGAAARAAADTWTLRQWASRLAACAGPKDFVGQLRAVYRGVLARWRYVLEHGEQIPASARSVLGHVLGAAYNCQDPLRCDVELTPWRSRGWGDCDDVSTLVAAAVRALGMRPLFRVARKPGLAHVSVVAITPRGRAVDVDPVGHPDHQFGWALRGPDVRVEFFDLEGNRVTGPAEKESGPMRVPALPMDGTGPRFAPMSLRQPIHGTWIVGPTGPRRQLSTTHLCAIDPRDRSGPRVLSMPQQEADAFAMGYTVDGARAVDQFGATWEYDAQRDVWARPGYSYSSRALGDCVSPTLSGVTPQTIRSRYTDLLTRARSRARRLAQHYRIVRRVPGRGVVVAHRETHARRFLPLASREPFGKIRLFKRIGRAFRRAGRWLKKKFAPAFRKVVGTILSSRVARTIICGALRILQIPFVVCSRLLGAAGHIMKEGGIIQLVRLAKRDPKAALKMLSQAVVQAGQGGLLSKLKIPGFSGLGDHDAQIDVLDNGRQWTAAPVAALAGLPGLYDMRGIEIDDEPTPGSWYQSRSGDNLLDIAEKAYAGTPVGNVTGARWINESDANANKRQPTTSKFNLERLAKNTGGEIVKLFPRWSCSPDENADGVGGSCFPVIWIPPAAGIEPPQRPPVDPDVPDVEPEPDRPDLPEPPPMPPPDIPPMPGPELPDEPPAPAPNDPLDLPVEPVPPTCAAGLVWDEASGQCVPLQPPQPQPTPSGAGGWGWFAAAAGLAAMVL